MPFLDRNLCAPQSFEVPNSNVQCNLDFDFRDPSAQSSGLCLGCGSAATLSESADVEVQCFIQACHTATLREPRPELSVALHDLRHYCAGCLCTWGQKSKGLPLKNQLHITGPRFFPFEVEQACRQEFDEVVTANPSVSHCRGPGERLESQVPKSRRTRRRINRRCRLEALGQGPTALHSHGCPKTPLPGPLHLYTRSSLASEAVIEPSRLARGAPRTQEREVLTEWRRCKQQEVVGSLTQGPGGPYTCAQSICRPNPCHSSLRGDPNPNLFAPLLFSNPGVRPDGCTRKIESSNSLCSPSLCLPSRKGSPNPNLAVFPVFAEKMARVACGFPEFSSLPGHFPGRETNPHFGAQNGTLSGSPTCLLRAFARCAPCWLHSP